MKNLILIVVVVGLCGVSNAQQLPLGSQYYTNMFTMNPAYTGSGEYPRAMISHRNQFNGLAGGPQTSMLSVNGPIKTDNIGLGVIAYTDATDILVKNSAMINYSYAIRTGTKSRLHFGLALGAQNYRIDFDKASVVNVSDPVLLGSRQTKTVFNADFGLMFETEKLQLGFAIPQLFTHMPTYTNVDQTSLTFQTKSHYRLMASYDLAFGSSPLTLKPMTMIRFVSGAPAQFDMNLILDYRKMGWFGITYHNGYAMAFSAGVRYKSFGFGYAHDFPLGNVVRYARNSSEFLLSYDFGKNQVANNQDDLRKEIEALKQKTEQQQFLLDSLTNELNRINEEIKIEKGRNNVQQDQIDSLEVKQLELENKIKEVKTLPSAGLSSEAKNGQKEAEPRKNEAKNDSKKGDVKEPVILDPVVEELVQTQKPKEMPKSDPKTEKGSTEKPAEVQAEALPKEVVHQAPRDSRVKTKSVEEYVDAGGDLSQAGFYVVTGSFSKNYNRDNWKKKMLAEGHKGATFLRNDKLNMTEVYIFYSKDRLSAIQAMEKYASTGKRAWVLELK
ncbi:MAG: PorP/SprF family type IX secretion system membrane protein [Crocinitomicaceae bacterium]|jgi:type IX secretion system PorP/SprF family membrane protein|nr:PorP/SprF family type IX secretion system membrane protein [Crocinitomicaceae bacterium]